MRAPAAIFAIPALRGVLVIAAAVFAVSMFAGIIRVIPLLLAASVPQHVAIPLMRGALSVSLEAALFVAPPIAWALVASRLVDRGEARSLAAVGVSPLGLIATSWPAVVPVAVAAALAAASWGREAAAPGRLARDLVAQARQGCAERTPETGAGAIDVPLLQVSFVCFPGQPPRVVGRAPFGGGRLVFLAKDVRLSDDLREIRMDDLSLLAPWGSPELGRDVRLRAATARVHGLAPLGRASNLDVVGRSALMAASAIGLAVLAAWLVLTGSFGSRVLAVALAVAGTGSALMTFSTLERSPAKPMAYVLVPLAGLCAMIAVARAAGWWQTRRREGARTG